MNFPHLFLLYLFVISTLHFKRQLMINIHMQQEIVKVKLRKRYQKLFREKKEIILLGI